MDRADRHRAFCGGGEVGTQETVARMTGIYIDDETWRQHRCVREDKMQYREFACTIGRRLGLDLRYFRLVLEILIAMSEKKYVADMKIVQDLFPKDKLSLVSFIVAFLTIHLILSAALYSLNAVCKLFKEKS
jgi:hypothetical protein